VRQQLPIGKPWFRVIGRTVEPITWEGWAAFYVILTWITGGTYYAFTGRDPLGLPIDGVLAQGLGLLAIVAFVACALTCILKTDFSRPG
jgi:hypothetical protein